MGARQAPVAGDPLRDGGVQGRAGTDLHGGAVARATMDWGASPPASVLIVNDDGLPCSKWCPFLSTFIAVLSQQGGIRRVFV